jgi:hypothetical protein
MLSLDFLPWFFDYANKLMRGFFWCAAITTNGGHCKVAWDTVCSPKLLGGLGIKNLRLLNIARRLRWRWLDQTVSDKPWIRLEFHLSTGVEQLFLSVYSLGDGRKFQFWKDTWIEGRSIGQIPPDLIKFVNPSMRQATVREGLSDSNWIRAIRGNPTIPALG